MAMEKLHLNQNWIKTRHSVQWCNKSKVRSRKSQYITQAAGDDMLTTYPTKMSQN